MNTTQIQAAHENHFVADNKKSGHNGSGFFNVIKTGIRAAAAAKVYPNDKETLIRVMSED